VALLVFGHAQRADAQSSPPANAWAYLQDVATGGYMTATASSDAGLPGQLQLLPFDAGARQLFQLEDQGGGVVSIRSKALPRRVITTSRTDYSKEDQYKQPGLVLWLYDWVKGGNQTWRLEKVRSEGKVEVVRLQNRHSGLYAGMNADGWLEHAVRDQAREWRVFSADDPPRPVPGQFPAVFLEPLGPREPDGAVVAQANGTVAIQRKKGFRLGSKEPKDPEQHFMLFPMHDGTTVFVTADGTRSLRWERSPDGVRYGLRQGPLAFDATRRFQRIAEPSDGAFSIQIPGTDQLLTGDAGAPTFAPKGAGAQTFGVVEARLHARWVTGGEGLHLPNQLEPEAVQAYWTGQQAGFSLALQTDVTQQVKWPESTRTEIKRWTRHDALRVSSTMTRGTPHSAVQPYHLGLFSGADLRWSGGGAVIHWYRILGTQNPDYLSGRSEWLFMTKRGLSRYATGGFELQVIPCRQACWKGDSTPADMTCLGYLCARDEQELTTRMAYMGFSVAEFGASVASLGAAAAAKASTKVAAKRTVRQILGSALNDVGKEAGSRGMGALVGPAQAHVEAEILARLGFLEGSLLAGLLNEEPTGIYEIVRAFYLPSCDCNERLTPPAPSTEAPRQAYPYKLNTGTALQETGANFAFAVLPGGDLMAIMKSGSGSRSTEVHILTAASQYRQFRLHTGTALHQTDGSFAFAALPNGDLMAIKKSGTGSRSTEVHILGAASQYQKFTVQTGTCLHETDGTWAFAALRNGDLMAIKKSGTGSRSTEVHVLSAASRYQKFALQTGTALQETDEKYAFAALPSGDLMAIMKSGTATRSTEIHILTAASQYKQFRLHTGTALPETGDTVEFGALDGDRLVAIKKIRTGTRSTEVHVVGP